MSLYQDWRDKQLDWESTEAGFSVESLNPETCNYSTNSPFNLWLQGPV